MSFDLPAIQKSTRRVLKILRQNSRRPNVKIIHDIRANCRSLETAYVTLNLDSKRNQKRLRRELRELRKRAGKVRDMDALTAAALLLQRDHEQDCLVRLLEHLGAERRKYEKKLHSFIKAANPRLMRQVDRASARVEKLLKRAINDPALSNTVPLTVEKTSELGGGLKKPATLTQANLHKYRLKVKKLRNLLQLTRLPGSQEFVADLGEVKDAIGAWHDCQELSSIATEVLDHTPCELRSDLQVMTDAKYAHALRLGNQLRANYLAVASPDTEKNSVSESAPPTGVLDATATASG